MGQCSETSGEPNEPNVTDDNPPDAFRKEAGKESFIDHGRCDFAARPRARRYPLARNADDKNRQRAPKPVSATYYQPYAKLCGSRRETAG